MSEMQQLKENADRALVQQKLNAIAEYMLDLSKSCLHRLEWSIRCDKLEAFAFLGYFVILLTSVWLDTSREFHRTVMDLAFFVVMIAIIRSWNANKLWREKEGEYTGATNILRMLGMLPDVPPPGERKKRKVISEFFGTMKAWATEKAAQMKKGYAPA